MSGLLGSFLHQIDDKGRISLPAAFRREGGDRPMVLVQVQPESLTLYPADAWDEVEVRLRELLRRQPAARGYVLGVTANATEVVPDKQGRILVPQRLLAGAGLNGTALLVGVIDRIELWAPERFEEATSRAAPDFDRYSHQVFG